MEVTSQRDASASRPEAGVASTALCVAHEATGAVSLCGLEQLAERLGALSRLKVPVTSVSKREGVCVKRSEHLCQSSACA
jgi:hypothetical protein